jgi:hypothetical protein
MAQPPYQQPGQQQPAQGYGQPPAQQGWTSSPTPARGPWTGRQKLAGGLLIGGALLAILGSFLPWVSVSVDTFDESANGFNEGASDGYIVVVAAIVAIVFGALSLTQANPPRRGVITLGIISSLLLLWIGLANLGEIGDQAPGVEVFGGEVNTGIGLILVTVAGIVVAAGAVVAIMAQRAVNAGNRGGGQAGGGQQQYGQQQYGQQGYQQQGQYQPPPQQQAPPQQAPPQQYQPPQQPGGQQPPR